MFPPIAVRKSKMVVCVPTRSVRYLSLVAPLAAIPFISMNKTSWKRRGLVIFTRVPTHGISSTEREGKLRAYCIIPSHWQKVKGELGVA